MPLFRTQNLTRMAVLLALSVPMLACAEADWMRAVVPSAMQPATVAPPAATPKPSVAVIQVKPIDSPVASVAPVAAQEAVPDEKQSQPVALAGIAGVRENVIRLGKLSATETHCGPMPELNKKIAANLRNLISQAAPQFGQIAANQLLPLFMSEQMRGVRTLRTGSKKDTGKTCQDFSRNLAKILSEPLL